MLNLILLEMYIVMKLHGWFHSKEIQKTILDFLQETMSVLSTGALNYLKLNTRKYLFWHNIILT